MVDLESVEGYPEAVEGCSGRESRFVSILRSFDDRWYIGQIAAPKRRIIQHVGGGPLANQWVRQYPPVAVASVFEFDTGERALAGEREIAAAFARHYGSDRVRGGGQCAT